MEIQIKEKNRIINEEKSKNENLNKIIKRLQNKSNNISQTYKILELEDEIKQLKAYILSPGEKLITIKFISVDQNINFTMAAKNTDDFAKVEKILYYNYPKYKETENYFLINGKKVNRNKTLEENKIRNNDVLTLNIIDDL